MYLKITKRIHAIIFLFPVKGKGIEDRQYEKSIKENETNMSEACCSKTHITMFYAFYLHLIHGGWVSKQFLLDTKGKV